jgi:hypothetical protein
MSEQSVIVWDLETVPDLAAAARMLDMSNVSESEVREALGPGFPKHPLQPPVRNNPKEEVVPTPCFR